MNVLDNLYGILTMTGNYEDRLVANTKEADFEVDTVYVTDRTWEYETAVRYKGFNDNDWIVVDSADSRYEARKVHDKWVEKLTKEKPAAFYDIYTGEVFEEG